MRQSRHGAVNTWLNCSFFALISYMYKLLIVLCAAKPDPPTLISLTNTTVSILYRSPEDWRDIAEIAVMYNKSGKTVRTIMDYRGTKHVVTDLTADTVYEFRIAISHKKGDWGRPSEALRVKTKKVLPAADRKCSSCKAQHFTVPSSTSSFSLFLCISELMAVHYITTKQADWGKHFFRKR